ncbi:hypothetical protein LCGC14_0609120 [marine sediment metagenome]|uniref:Uncharacterized protein n=1 Tax=marine sediment metagenome TaxID=412755 RepID=A0A0F9RD65_9ZZZZ
MSLAYGHIRIDYEPHPGSTIQNVCNEVTALSKKKNVVVEFVLNGVRLKAYPITEPSDLMDKYHEEIEDN